MGCGRQEGQRRVRLGRVLRLVLLLEPLLPRLELRVLLAQRRDAGRRAVLVDVVAKVLELELRRLGRGAGDLARLWRALAKVGPLRMLYQPCAAQRAAYQARLTSLLPG